MILLLVKLSGYILAEILPFSAEAQIILINYYFKYSFWNKDFEIMANLVFLLTIFVYFFRDFIKMFQEFLKGVFFAFSGRASLKIISSDFKMLNILLVTLLIGTSAYCFYFIKTDYSYSKIFIASMLIVSGLLLRVSEIFTLVKKDPRVLSVRDSFVFSLLQVLSFIPGIPRTAVMMSLGKFMGVEKNHLIRMIFVSLVPILFLNLYHLGLVNVIEVIQSSWTTCLVLLIILLSLMNWILSILRSTSFYKFYYYLVGLGVWTILDLLFAKR
jgi:undecaprenyl pyrophosphate phosphatase UppP